jgi:hypothetical protein
MQFRHPNGVAAAYTRDMVLPLIRVKIKHFKQPHQLFAIYHATIIDNYRHLQVIYNPLNLS